MEHKITEQWQPGKVEINKISKGFPYLVATDLAAPLHLATQQIPPPPYPLRRSSPQLEKNIRKRKWLFHVRRETATMWQEALLDSGATSNFTKPSDNLPVTGTSDKTVVIANGDQCHTTNEVQLPLAQLRNDARVAHVLRALESRNLLMSLKVLADSGYTTIFGPHDDGVQVHDSADITLTSSKPAVLHGWCNPQGHCIFQA